MSPALNNKPGVSTRTRQKVLEAARLHGYDLSRKAGGLNTKKGTICFVIYKKIGAVVDDTPFFAALSDGVGLGAKKAAMIFRFDIFTATMTWMSRYTCLRRRIFPAWFFWHRDIPVPFVVLDAYFETLELNYILINNVQGAYLATGHLISRRRSQPGYLRSAYPIGNFDQRADGFYKAIRRAGLSTSKSLVHRLTPSEEGAYADMRALLENGEEPADCYFADNDHIAIGAIRALTEAGYRVPEDVAVAGFDDLPVCAYHTPPLTTIHVPIHYMGETAARRLAQIIEGKDALPVKIEISTSLVKRKSV